ncbi:hypothetical protein DL96DRAFT_1620649 [Flagelloscypha sp. PMI_526]|nr:hypothetical protein DL96DRAFT_1620649 [Flagelloscypha sp. PMI_526]
MSPPRPGMIQVTSLESSPLLTRGPIQRGFSQIKSFPTTYAIIYLSLPYLVFLSTAVLGRLLLRSSKSQSAKAEYVSAMLAGVCFEFSVIAIAVAFSFVDNIQRQTRLVRLLRALKTPEVMLPLNVVIGGPIYLVLSGLILRHLFMFPDIEMGELVKHYFAALPFVAFIVAGIAWWSVGEDERLS